MRITIEDDFNLYKITYSGQCFRPQMIDEQTYMFVTGNSVLQIKSISDRQFDVSCSIDEWNNIWAHYFDLDTSYKDIRLSIPQQDIFIKNASELGCGIRILNQDKFEMLISFIISQRKSIPAIKSSIEKICTRYGTFMQNINGTDIYAFPTPAELAKATQDELAECGLGYRVPYILNAVKAVNAGIIDLEKIKDLDDEKLFEKLKSLYGVGDKVANCICLFAYHRTSRAPVDTWIAKVIHEEYNDINPFPSYGNVAGIIQQYVFYSSQHLRAKRIGVS